MLHMVDVHSTSHLREVETFGRALYRRRVTSPLEVPMTAWGGRTAARSGRGGTGRGGADRSEAWRGGEGRAGRGGCGTGRRATTIWSSLSSMPTPESSPTRRRGGAYRVVDGKDNKIRFSTVYLCESAPSLFIARCLYFRSTMGLCFFFSTFLPLEGLIHTVAMPPSRLPHHRRHHYRLFRTKWVICYFRSSSSISQSLGSFS